MDVNHHLTTYIGGPFIDFNQATNSFKIDFLMLDSALETL